eukprot:SAG31_NODE_1319_length_8817_cov_1.857077_13_plen_121_part_00
MHEARTSDASASIHLTITANTQGHSTGIFIKHLLGHAQSMRLKHWTAGMARQLEHAMQQLASIDIDGSPLRAALPVRLHSEDAAQTIAKSMALAGLDVLKSSIIDGKIDCGAHAATGLSG